MNKIKVCFIDGASLSNQVLEVIQDLNNTYGEYWQLSIINLSKLGYNKPSKEFINDICSSNLVIADIRGENPFIDFIGNITRDLDISVVPLVGGNEKLSSIIKMGNFQSSKYFEIDEIKNLICNFRGGLDKLLISNLKDKLHERIIYDIKNYFKVINYWGINGKTNIKNMLIMLSREYGNLDFLEKEEDIKHIPKCGIYNPFTQKTYKTINEYGKDHNFNMNKPTIGILYYSGMHFENCLVPTKMMIKKFENKANIVPIISDGIRNLEVLNELCLKDDKGQIDLLINMTWFRLNGGPLGGNGKDTIDLLNKINVPVFHPITMYQRSVEDWEKEISGISQIDYLANVVLPEIDGSIESLPVCGSLDLEKEVKGLEKIIPIEERIEKVVNRGTNIANLSKIKNEDKKIAIIMYDYPPGEGNLGNAAYMDTFESIYNILDSLEEDGYKLKCEENYNNECAVSMEKVKYDFISKFEKTGMVNSSEWTSLNEEFVKISVKEYTDYLNTMPKIKEEVEKNWGKAPGNLMTDKNFIYLPILTLENIIVGLQPSKGIHENSEKVYHDKSLPPHHQYIAFYYYLREKFKSNAIIHVGTHGTLEFAPGKEMGMSKDCYSDTLIGDIPHFYIYQAGNPSEATIAKRRALATLVSYKTPSVTNCGLYGDLLELQDLLNQLEEAKLFSKQRVPVIEENILEVLKKGNWSVSKVDEVESMLNEYKRKVIPQGLHIFGQDMENKELKEFLYNILRFDRGSLKSLNRVIAEIKGYNYEDILKEKGKQLIEVDNRAISLVNEFIDNENIENKYEEDLKNEDLKNIYDFAKETTFNLRKNQEIEGLLKVLRGEYLEAGLSSDPLKNPEVMPSGRNLYQFDPMKIPTDSACKRGKIIALNTLNKYREIHERYPNKTGVILWGFETAKTYGETVGQILEYIGVRINSKPGDWFPQLEIIPLEELGHPRIDVVVNICGFFRDMFPNVVGLLDRAFRLVGSLEEDEKNNFVKLNCNLEAEKINKFIPDKKFASMMSQCRIFGPKSGEYGTRLTSMIETSNWDEENQIAKVYEEDMSYAYGMMFNGKESKELFKSQASKIEMVTQVQDTYEYEVTDLDHYYEFFGGLSSVVKNLSNKSPEMIVTNTSTEEIITEDISNAIRRGVKTRNLNPKWIDGLLKHKYHGGQKISDRVQYEIGLAATTGKVENWVFEEMFETYLDNEEMLERLKENNLHATLDITKRMYEANNRSYWDASEEQIEKLKEIYLSLEANIEMGDE